MARTDAAKKTKRAAKKTQVSRPATPDGFINVAVSRSTRQGLHLLKDAMNVQGQAEVIERLVTIGIAIYIAAR
jgi:hypothetical protein